REGRRSETLDPIGNGSTVASVRQNHTSGIIEHTGRSLDAAIDGNGFFMVGNREAPQYTRAGVFVISEDGFLVDAKGNQVLGFPATLPAEGETGVLGPLNMQDIGQVGTP